MIREVSLEEISDGKLYTANDMVKADCNDCEGCFDCCMGMESLVLDPMDIFRLEQGMARNFEALISEGYIELGMVDGLIIPNIKMNGVEEKCSFLNDGGRCTIHSFRPGICRLFPLGRYYEEEGFKYFLQVHECKNKNRTKIKVKKWLDTPELKRYEQYIWDWHVLQKKLQAMLDEGSDMELRKKLGMTVLQIFYMKPYDFNIDFYSQFEERKGIVEELLK